MSTTREEIISKAENLIRTKGYNAFSYKDISVPLNVKNAAIHYHFPTKAGLGAAVINKNMELFEVQTKKWESLSEKNQLDEFIKIYEKSSLSSLVCFMGALGPSFETLPLEMQKELTAASLKIRNWLKNLLGNGRSQGQFSFKETVDEKADLIISSMLSSLILERVTKLQIFQNVRTAIQTGL